MLANDRNITAWFRDAATRHPDIRHSDADQRFFELEWEDLLASGKKQGAKGWYLILEDYTEKFHDPDAEYITITPEVAFLVVRSVPRGKVAEKMQTYEEARRIAKSIVAKLYRDYVDGCDADVPAGVTVPRLVDLNTLRIDRVSNVPLLDNAYGVRTQVMIRTDTETTFTRDEGGWLPLETES